MWISTRSMTKPITWTSPSGDAHVIPREGGHWFRYASLHRLFEAKTYANLWTVREGV